MKILLTILALILLSVSIEAGDVQVLKAEFKASSENTWNVDVTLKHDDTGWKHYADNWRVVDADGNILGDRVLYHPHVNEQPFTRGLSNISIDEGTRTVFIEAHDKEHGWTKKRLRIDLNKSAGSVLKVEAD
jgi:hypothetical protein